MPRALEATLRARVERLIIVSSTRSTHSRCSFRSASRLTNELTCRGVYYQRITPDPAKHRQVSIVYFGLCALSGLAALLAAGGTPLRLLGGAVLLLGCCLFMAFLPRIAKEQDYR